MATAPARRASAHAPAHPKNPTIEIHDGKVTTTSLAVAEYFEKRHDNVLAKIRALLPVLPEGYRLLNFKETEIEVRVPASGATRKDPAYELTRDAFTLIAMGFTGKQALAWKVKYIEAFNAMEAKLKEQAKPTTPALPSFQRLMMTLENGQMTNIKAIPEASCVIDPNNPLNVATFIREFVPSSQYPELFTLLAEHLTKYRPAAGLPNEINEAINRKAAEKALEGFVCIREKMERHAKFRLETPRLSKESVLAQIEAFEGLEGELVLVNASDLRSLTASLAAMGVVVKHAENAVHAIERMTGREWYGRTEQERTK